MFLGSTSFVTPLVCQNDIWFNDGSPAAPVNGDSRLILQAAHDAAGILYRERWEAGRWRVTSMPPEIEVIIEVIAGQPQAGFPVILGQADIVNNFQEPQVVGYFIDWVFGFKIRAPPHSPLYYIKHSPRGLNTQAQGKRYMLPLRGGANSIALRKVKWNTQISQARRGTRTVAGPELDIAD